MSEKSIFIVIEGLDGSGKSTICEKLGHKLNCTIYKTPSFPYSKIRSEVDSTADAAARFFFYLSSVFYASTEISALLKKNSVVCDRYLYSTICYHAILNPSFSKFAIGDWNILRPDFTFFLSTPFEERVRRIAAREASELSGTNVFPVIQNPA
jgi:thymidylate kinase